MSTVRPAAPLQFWRLVFPAVAWAALVLGAPTPAAEPETPVPFRLAFSSAMFTEINENDARASVKAWAQTVARERGVAASPDALITKGAAAAVRALRDGEADAVGLPIDEFAAVSRAVAFSHVFIAVVGGALTEDYLVLVPRDSPVEHLAQLRGRELLVFKSPRTSLAEPWLDTQLRQSHRSEVATFFGRIQRVPKLSRAILPVFFQQADACLVTRRGFETMSELNPQIGRQLRIVAESPAVVPAVFAIRATFRAPTLPAIVASLLELHTTPAGQQVLLIFQSERLEEEHPPLRLAPSLAMLADHAQNVSTAGAKPHGPAPGPSSTNAGAH